MTALGPGGPPTKARNLGVEETQSDSSRQPKFSWWGTAGNGTGSDSSILDRTLNAIWLSVVRAADLDPV